MTCLADPIRDENSAWQITVTDVRPVRGPAAGVLQKAREEADI